MMHVYPYKSKYEITDNNIQGYIHSYKMDGNKLTMSIIGKEKIIVNYYFKTLKEKNDFSYKLGDELLIKGEMVEPKRASVYNLFDYRLYLYHNNIYYIFNADEIKLVSKNKKIRYFIKEKIVEHINDLKYSKDYVKALVIGDDDGFKDTVNTSYQFNGVSHLFAISGSHITFLAVIILWLLKKLRIEENKRYYVVILFLIFYMFLTDYAGSVLRAVVFFSILAINKMYYLHIKTINVLQLTAVFLLLWKPGIIYDVGFQFSYVISFYLILYQTFINKSSNYVIQTLIISVISFAASIPICINNFFQINLLSPIINLFFVPYVSFLMFPLAFLCLIIPFLDIILFFFVNILEYISIFLSNVKIGVLILAKPNVIILVIYYVIITLSLRGLFLKKYKYIITLILIVIIHHNINAFRFYPTVTFIDVGQGDSAFVNLPFNKGNILIDTGGILNIKEDWEQREREYKIGEDTIIPYLKSIGISHLDYLILSHGDADHMGESLNIVKNFKVKSVIMNNGGIVELEKSLIYQLNIKNIPYSFYKQGDVLNVDKYSFKFLNPHIDTNENDNSLVIYTNLNNNKMMFMGDASTKIEQQLVSVYSNLKVDILKVGHHGSITSTSEAFLDALEPKYAVISVGLHNRFNHPSKTVLKRLEQRNVKILKTSTNGSIKMILRANGVTLISALS